MDGVMKKDKKAEQDIDKQVSDGHNIILRFIFSKNNELIKNTLRYENIYLYLCVMIDDYTYKSKSSYWYL